MTTEEKLQHFYDVSMNSAQEEAQKALSEYRASLEQEMEQHKREKQAASDNRFKIESENAAREINKALSAEHLHIKRKLSKKQQALKETFCRQPEYTDWMEEKIRAALAVAGNDEVKIYVNSSDAALLEELEKRTGMTPLLSDTDFMGGIRAVIPDKNILIDNTFLTCFENEKESFNFDGGIRHE